MAAALTQAQVQALIATAIKPLAAATAVATLDARLKSVETSVATLGSQHTTDAAALVALRADVDKLLAAAQVPTPTPDPKPTPVPLPAPDPTPTPTPTPPLGALAQFPVSADGFSALDYGGFCVAPNGDALLFGGGHAATAMPDAWRLPNGGTAWVSDYPVPTRDQVMTAWGNDPNGWLSVPGFPKLPATVHSYSGNIWSHAINRFLKMSPTAGGWYGIPEGKPYQINQTIGEYDPVTKTWTDTGIVMPLGGPAAMCEDPVSGNIIGIVSSGFMVYDPRQRKLLGFTQNDSSLIGYDDHVVYHPPKDKFYIITRAYGWLNPACPHVVELTLDRASWTHAMRDTGLARPATSSMPTAGILGWAYDPASQMIVGGYDRSVVTGFHPDKGWFQHPAPTVNSDSVMLYHHWAYDEKNARHLFIHGVGAYGATYAFKGEAAKWVPMAVNAPDVIATINGGAFGSLEDACNAGVPLTLSVGVLRSGGAVTKPGTTSIVGAGTHLIGGAVWGKAQIVVSASSPLTVSGISFEDAAVADANGAGIRHDSGSLAVNDCAFSRCQDGYLGNADVAFNRCSFTDCGAGDGQSHGVYVSNGSKVASATDCTFTGTKIGHHFKSRALRSSLTRCKMTAGTESYSCDFPWGGQVAIDACQMTKGADSDNDNCVINYGSEVNATPFAAHSFAMSNTTLTYTGAVSMIGVRFDAKVPVDAVFTNCDFNGIATPQTGARSAKFINCRRDGVAIP
jgi:hypothetical protein